MATAIIMPKAGMAMEEGTIVKWLKAEGDRVEQGEPLLEILTDKVNMEVEAQISGILIKILKEEGEVVPVIRTIGYIGEAGEAVPESALYPRHSGVGCLTDEEGEAVPGRPAATPAAKRTAAERKINLSQVKGSGPRGEIRARDVEEYKSVIISPLARRAAEAKGLDVSELTGSGHGGKILMQDVASKLNVREAGAAQTPASGDRMGMETGQYGLSAGQVTADGKEIAEVIPYSGIRRVIGDRMVQSKFTAPHLYFSQQVNLEKLIEVRKQINKAQEEKTSVTDYIARAAVKALQKYPDFNVSLMGEKIVRYKSINIGIAVAAPGGLIVPVIKYANGKSVIELSQEAGILFEKARNGKLKPDEYTGGTFTISNLGMFGIDNFTAIINQPESGILAVSAAKDEAVVVADEAGNKSIQIKPVMNITLTADHRVVDGLVAAQFVTEIQRLLENPIELLI